MKDSVKELAEVYGLSVYEAKLYATLTARGPMLVAKLAEAARIPRTAVYPPLSALLTRGLVAKTSFGKRLYYSAASPETLRSIFEHKRASIEAVIATLNESRRVTSGDANLDAVLYVGPEGIKSAGLLFLQETKEKEWYSFENLASVTDAVGATFEESYIRERVKKGIRSKMLLSVPEESPFIRRVLADDKKQLRETVILSSNFYPLETTIVATKGLLLLIQPHTHPYALLVRNPHLASTIISIHQCVWDRFRK